MSPHSQHPHHTKEVISILIQEKKSLEFAVNSSRDLEPGQQPPGSNSSSSRYRDQRIITKKEYFLFCFGFSVSVAPVIGVFTFAPVIFGRGGGVGNGIFCIGYTLSSLFYTRNIITSYGSKSAILWGHFGSGVYVAYYLLCTTVAFRYSNIIYPMGAFIGGISQSIMWTAQAKYYTLASQFFISSMNSTEIEKSHREMAFLFHRTYLINLVVMFAFVTLVLLLKIFVLAHPGTSPYLFIPTCGVYFAVSSYFLLSTNPIGDTGDLSSSVSLSASKSIQTLRSIFRSLSAMSSLRKWKTLYLLPFHVAWGLIHPLWVYFILGWVIGDTNLELGGLALLNSLTTLLYALIDKRYFFRHSSASTPHRPPSPAPFYTSLSGGILLGAMGYLGIGVLLLYIDIRYTRSSNLWIVTLVTVLHGFIRSVCENNMMATLADYFPQKEIPTYLIMGTTKTLVSGICFIGFGLTDPRHMNKMLYGVVILIVGSMALLGYLRAAQLNHYEKEYLEGEKILKYLREEDQERAGSNSRCDSSIATTDLTTATGVAVLKGTYPTSCDLSQHSLPAIPPLPPSLRLHSQDSSETESVLYVAEYF